MLTYSRAGGGTFVRALSNAMRENPLPSLLIGAGCMMFLSDKMGLRAGSRGNGGRPMMATADHPYGYGAGGPSSVADAAGRLSDAAGRQTEFDGVERALGGGVADCPVGPRQRGRGRKPPDDERDERPRRHDEADDGDSRQHRRRGGRRCSRNGP